MKLNTFSPIPENDDELHLPELVYWSSLGDVEQVKNALDQGVDVNSTDEDGYSALQAAAENNYLEVVKLLVAHGADIHFKGQYTALELAEMAENQEIIEYLKGID
ncbi:ankyrin repeat domain-containing protein [Acinetobacter rudis]|uniref:ankyrin repeat domain-containing protein n=1 Tax=Acinetobacter rudis TaxID=632955 RepID=UPI00333FA3BF